ncbi:MAG: hypothetical protein EP330_16660 [Deltaproteobacteria bacterium]|nr:MAG: hypothetical protein EP330_16660 [Deltaproteobacteria bacterium]
MLRTTSLALVLSLAPAAWASEAPGEVVAMDAVVAEGATVAPTTAWVPPSPALAETFHWHLGLPWLGDMRVRGSGFGPVLGGTGLLVAGGASFAGGVAVFVQTIEGVPWQWALANVFLVVPTLLAGGLVLGGSGLLLAEVGLIGGSYNAFQQTGRRNPLLWANVGSAALGVGCLVAMSQGVDSPAVGIGAVGGLSGMFLTAVAGTVVNHARLASARRHQLALMPVVGPEQQGLALSARF